ncbi:MAG: PIN domain-containing protein [Pleurocapsa sp. SU_5_0]|jgi:predicted nucleic acid-binding protein|nr:PIN domain-containing protein [Pleurocapsa sp. SU_5_0]
MAYLLDTNILLRTISPNDPMHIETVAAIDILNAGREQVIIAPQNLIELWNVCTRPAERNGLGFTPERTRAEVDRLKRLFIFIPDTPAIFPEWERLVTTYEVKGTKVHDTRLVAFMLVHRLSQILTFNVKDFRRFSPEITPVSPKEIVNS